MRLIDADALMPNAEHKGRYDVVTAYDIANAPTIKTGQWIPCSERLPKPYEHCLWTTTDGRVIYHHCDGLFSNYTAWMPLPEPYREEGEA